MWHDGSIPGVNTVLGFLPSDGLGFVVLINSDVLDDQPLLIAAQIIANYVAANSSTSTTQVATSDLSARDQFVSDSPPTIPVTRRSPSPRTISRRVGSSLSVLTNIDLTGTYYNRGYGSITFCSAASTATSSVCLDLLANFSAVDSVSGSGFNASDPKGGELVASPGKFFAPQIRLVPSGSAPSTDASGNTTIDFIIVVEALFPEGYGVNTTAFEELLGDANATFVIGGAGTSGSDGNSTSGATVYGFGVSGTVGAETDRERRGGSVEETADVWFGKL